ncbi:MAG: hypothetical protein RML94_02360 [Bacteroidia bacterium]|nr:hypothetical protein [Bacteroidia bacterium]
MSTNRAEHPKTTCVRHAEGASAVRSVAQHRSEAQPAARRPCGHERSETPTRTRPRYTLQ